MKQDSIRISLTPGTVIPAELHSQFIEHLGSAKTALSPMSRDSEKTCWTRCKKSRRRSSAGLADVSLIPTIGRMVSVLSVR